MRSNFNNYVSSYSNEYMASIRSREQNNFHNVRHLFIVIRKWPPLEVEMIGLSQELCGLGAS